MKKILVTGAAGFIGFHLCRKLLKNGYKVIGIDNIITRNIYWIDKNVTGVISLDNNFEIPSFTALILTAPTNKNIPRDVLL